jgi:hypothetical protein
MRTIPGVMRRDEKGREAHCVEYSDDKNEAGQIQEETGPRHLADVTWRIAIARVLGVPERWATWRPAE